MISYKYLIITTGIIALNTFAMENNLNSEQYNTTQTLLESFALHGLIPAAQVEKETGLIPKNSVDNANHNGVFTSCLCLGKLSLLETDKAIDDLLHHNYLGIYNMAIERKYILKYDHNEEMGAKKDLQDRLLNSMLFILEPELIKVNFKLGNNKHSYDLKLLIEQAHMMNLGRTHCVTEQDIKFSVFAPGFGEIGTKGILQVIFPNGFTWDKIKAVIVPTPLKEHVNKVFRDKNIPIFEAPLVIGKLRLSHFTRDVSIDCLAWADDALIKDMILPDYKHGLDKMRNQLGLLTFATHITRLTTPNDLVGSNIQTKEEVAGIIKANNENSMGKRLRTLDADPRTVFFPESWCHFCTSKDKLSACSKCKATKYCSTKCQGKDWPDHKKYCNSK